MLCGDVSSSGGSGRFSCRDNSRREYSSGTKGPSHSLERTNERQQEVLGRYREQTFNSAWWSNGCSRNTRFRTPDCNRPRRRCGPHNECARGAQATLGKTYAQGTEERLRDGGAAFLPLLAFVTLIPFIALVTFFPRHLKHDGSEK